MPVLLTLSLTAGSKVPGHHLHVNQQLHDDGPGVCGEYHQGSPGQDQGAVPTDQHRPRAAHQGYRGAHQGGQEGEKGDMAGLNQVNILLLVQVQDLLETIKEDSETEENNTGKSSK